MKTDSPLILVVEVSTADALAPPDNGKPASLVSLGNTGVSGVPGRTLARKMRSIA